ncbi:MAG: glycosyltransferase family 2 protein [Alphaproteobacteria bacterium]|nr:glycosyltransferase family 2 protein [Alphaproteobacteria bacterium]
MAESAKLSALVVARNEAAQLGACLATLGFADEVVVLLDRSIDSSATIARDAGVKVIEGAWDIEGPRRNAGYESCAGPWILEVDADERVTPELAAEIRAALPDAKADYFLVPMANHIGSRLVRYGWGAYNGVAAKPVLFRKGAKRVLGGRVHPKIEIHGKRRTLRTPMLHFVDRDFSDLFARLNRYTDLAALDARDFGRKPNVAQAFRRFWSRGWKSYVARRGYREGAYGIALALFSALYPLLIELKLATLGDKP